MVKPRAWSLSALTSYETCPRKHHEVNVLKRFKEPESQALVWGNRVHKAAENYVRSKARFPKGMDRLAAAAEKIVGAVEWDELHAERKFALNRKLQETEYFARDVWLRCIADVLAVKGDLALVVDWKTGKRKFEDDQLALLAACVFRGYPNVTKVKTCFVWVGDDFAVDPYEFYREDEQSIWSRFTARVGEFERAFVEEDFPPRPSGLCKRHCVVRTCEYHGGM